jgi:hypothetical protein
MVENLAKSPEMCSDGPGSAPIETPKREAFSLRGSKKERREKIGSGWGKEERCLLDLIPRPGSHLRSARADGPRHPADSPRGARTVRTPSADGPLLHLECPVMHLLPTSHADGPRCPDGQSARSSQTVRPITRAVRPPLLILA